ncbi:hypothetical protein [Marinobacterium arenosum]|uniref:hypothetical protein n=1 Tax=Marinobacterium arenosum TaxID=2862496 RepID=UPI001C94BC2E|nr:hypothetical protein [Marinobacterium arenosum]MBY4678490.1 hypothetical protein [Marinobacterium arenosum]
MVWPKDELGHTDRRIHRDRRRNGERREETRFEPDKPERRLSRGRRSEDRDPWVEKGRQQQL